MRLFERALTSIGQKLNVKNPKPGWDDYITALDEEVAKPWKDRTIKGKHQEVSEVTAHLRAVKNAWRNPTMHVSGTYDFDRASAIFDATKGLMKAIVTSGVFELVGSDPKAS